MKPDKNINTLRTSRCAVVGHGSWATALVKVLSTNEPVVGWYVRNPEVMESLRSEGRNCRYLSDIEFDMSRIDLSDDLNELVAGADIIFLVTPAAYLKCYLSDLKVPLKDKLVVSAIKGIIPDEIQFVTDYLKQHYDLDENNEVLISGPTHAEEVRYGKNTHLTLACANEANAEAVAAKIRTSFIKVNCMRNLDYLEYSSVMKNIYAVVVGIAVGMGYGDNFISVLVSNCIAEMYKSLDSQSINELTYQYPSSFFGDLLVSCYSSHSRNRQLGVLIGRGNTVKTALNEMTMVAEGYFASRYVPNLIGAKHLQMPIAEITFRVLHKGLSARKAMKELESILV